jgi:hypothetical protein
MTQSDVEEATHAGDHEEQVEQIQEDDEDEGLYGPLLVNKLEVSTSSRSGSGA